MFVAAVHRNIFKISNVPQFVPRVWSWRPRSFLWWGWHVRNFYAHTFIVLSLSFFLCRVNVILHSNSFPVNIIVNNVYCVSLENPLTKQVQTNNISSPSNTLLSCEVYGSIVQTDLVFFAFCIVSKHLFCRLLLENARTHCFAAIVVSSSERGRAKKVSWIIKQPLYSTSKTLLTKSRRMANWTRK